MRVGRAITSQRDAPVDVDGDDASLGTEQIVLPTARRLHLVLDAQNIIPLYTLHPYSHLVGQESADDVPLPVGVRNPVRVISRSTLTVRETAPVPLGHPLRCVLPLGLRRPPSGLCLAIRYGSAVSPDPARCARASRTRSLSSRWHPGSGAGPQDGSAAPAGAASPLKRTPAAIRAAMADLCIRTVSVPCAGAGASSYRRAPPLQADELTDRACTEEAVPRGGWLPAPTAPHQRAVSSSPMRSSDGASSFAASRCAASMRISNAAYLRAGEQPRFERALVELLGQGPRQPGRVGAANVVAHR